MKPRRIDCAIADAHYDLFMLAEALIFVGLAATCRLGGYTCPSPREVSL